MNFRIHKLILLCFQLNILDFIDLLLNIMILIKMIELNKILNN